MTEAREDNMDDEHEYCRNGGTDGPATERLIDGLRAENKRLREVMAWVDQVYPESLPDELANGCWVEMTWGEYNAMREAIGLTPRKPRPKRKVAVRR